MSAFLGLASDAAAIGATVGLTEILFQSQKAKIGVLELDASVREVHRARATATSHPIEPEVGQAGEISDHIKVDPFEIVIDGVISDFPVKFANAIQVAYNDGSFEPSKEGYQLLLNYVFLGQLVTISTTLETYDNVVIEEVSVTRDSKKGKALFFTARGKQIRFVSLETAAISQRPPEGSTKAAGKKNPAPPESPQVAAEGTLATSVWDGLLGFLGF